MARFDRSGWSPSGLTYRPGGDTRCPECGQSNWIVGRNVAECAGCETALPIALPYWNTIQLRAA